MYKSIKRGSATLLSMIACCLVMNPHIVAADSSSSNANNESRTKSVLRVHGQVVTGSNRLRGMPIWDLGEDLGTLGYSFIHAHNPGQASPLPIDENTPGSAIMASGLDLAYMALFGLTEADIDPAIINNPIHQTPVISGPAGEITQLPGVMDVRATVASRIASNQPVTLTKWLSARGVAKFKCSQDGTSTVNIKMRSLVPDAMYSAWGVYSFDFDGNGVGEAIGGVPLGGVPNIMMTDSRGTASISRQLNFCPEDEPRLKYLTIALHSNASNNGSVPDQALLNKPGGTLAHAAMSFPINVIGCAQPANSCP